MNDFRNAKTGDRIWHITKGWGNITMPLDNNFFPDKIYTSFTGNNGNTFYSNLAFFADGRVNKEDLNPSIFWNEIKIVPPDKPKKLIEKSFEGFMTSFSYKNLENGFIERQGDLQIPNLVLYEDSKNGSSIPCKISVMIEGE